MRWVFIRPRNVSSYYDPEIQEPLGLQTLSALRRSKGDAVLLLDAALDAHDDIRLARRATAFAPDAIGFSLSTAQELTSALAVYDEAVRVLAQSQQTVHWIAGGNFVTSEPEHADRLLPPGWQLVRGEGELALDALVEDWAGSKIGPRVLLGTALPSLDNLPLADRPYTRQILANGWSFNLQGSRGCTGACHYCASPGLASVTRGARWRARSAGHLAEEVAQLQAHHGASCFNIVDEDFLGPRAGSRQRARDFSAALAQRQLRASFGIQVRPVSLDMEIIDTLAEAGVHYVFFGMESDDAVDLKRWGRPVVPPAWEYVDRLRARGIEVNVGTLLFHRASTLTSVRRFAEVLHARDLFDYRTAINRMDAIPGSALHSEERAAGRLDTIRPGPQVVRFADSRLEYLYEKVCHVLAPLGPPSMHAVCALPALSARQKVEQCDVPGISKLRGIIAASRDAVAKFFFSLLDQYQANDGQALPRASILEMRSRSLELALGLAGALAQNGLVSSFEQLREAIRIDAGE
jgi:hypothetical protein